jgi:hypothetical protein
MAGGALSPRLEESPIAQVRAASLVVVLYFILAHLGERALRRRNGTGYYATLEWWLKFMVVSGGNTHLQIFPWLKGEPADADSGENTGELAWRTTSTST